MRYNDNEPHERIRAVAWGSYDPNYSTHEPGHALQFALMGGWYYPFIALPSILNANNKDAGDSYTEKTANQLWY